MGNDKIKETMQIDKINEVEETDEMNRGYCCKCKHKKDDDFKDPYGYSHKFKDDCDHKHKKDCDCKFKDDCDHKHKKDCDCKFKDDCDHKHKKDCDCKFKDKKDDDFKDPYGYSHKFKDDCDHKHKKDCDCKFKDDCDHKHKKDCDCKFKDDCDHKHKKDCDCKFKDDCDHKHKKDCDCKFKDHHDCKCKNPVGDLECAVKALVDVIDRLNNCPYDCKLCDRIEDALKCLTCPVYYKCEKNVRDCDILDDIKDALKCILEDITHDHNRKTDFGFASQIDRLICLIDNLKRKLKAIDCQEACPNDLKAFLLCLLVDILTKLMSIILKLTILVRFRCKCREVFDCLLCGWVEEIDDLEDLIKKLDCIIVSLLECKLCTPCTTICHTPRPKNHSLDCECKPFKKKDFTW